MPRELVNRAAGLVSPDFLRTFGKIAVLGLGITLLLPFASQWWAVAAHNSLPCTECKIDFLSLYTGASLLRNDRHSLYDLEAQKAFQEKVQSEWGNWVLPFMNPPFTALLLLPLAWFSFQAAYVLMSAVNLFLLALSLRLLVRRLALSKDQTHWLLLFVLVNAGTLVAFLQAQTSFLLLFVTTSCLLAWKEGREIGSGIWSGLSAIKPQVGAVLLVLLQVPIRWRLLVASAASLGLLALLSVLAVGRDGTADFIALMAQAAGGNNDIGINAGRMHNLRALAMHLAPGAGFHLLWFTASVVVGAVAVVRCYRYGRDQDSLSRKIFLIGIAVLLLTPHLHTHDLVLLAVPVALLLHAGPRRPSPPQVLMIVILGLLPFLSLAAVGKFPPLVPVGLLLLLMAEPRFKI